MEKQCTKCKQPKDLSAFSVHQERKDGKSSYCMACEVIRNRVYRSNNGEKVREYHREYSKAWYRNNPEKSKATLKRGRIKRLSTIQGRLNHAIGTKMSKTLRGEKCFRKWEALIGYDAEQLKRHLEKQFTPEMSWDNYGYYWHIDHKIPIAAFNYTKPEDIDFQKCWNLKNLCPLSATENRIKNDKLDKPFQPSLTI